MNELMPQDSNLPANLNDRIAALKQKAKTETHEVWQPEVNETLAGEYIGHLQIEHPRYGAQWQLLLRDENGTVMAAWINQWLRFNLKAQNLTLGDIVAITYLGKRKTSAGTEYNAYSLIVDKA